jgi:hypothetical protein
MIERLELLLIVLIPIFLFIGIQIGRSIEVIETLEMREKITASWLQECDLNKERRKK